MALLTVKKPTLAGTNLASQAAGAAPGDEFPNTGVEFFYVKNNKVGALTLTFRAFGTCTFGLGDHTAHAAVATVPGGGAERLCGPFATPRFNDTDNRVNVSYSPSESSVLVAAIAAA